MRTDLENKLFNYLNDNPKIILDSLKYNAIYYSEKKWMLQNVEIEDDNTFVCYVILKEGWLPAITTLNIPQKFLRREKLEKINENRK